MKRSWQQVTGDYTRRERQVITKQDFPGLLGKVWKELDHDGAIAGF